MKKDNAIKIINCTKEYNKKNSIKVKALNNITYSFDYGSLYAIMGHSGSGKTTLLNIISMIDKKNNGKILINNIDVDFIDEKEKARIRNQDIGLIFQNYLLNDKMNSIENIILPMYINKNIAKNNRKKIAMQLLKLIGLENRANHFPTELSGGEQQRVAIARCLANNPKIILADEPTGNLDEENELFIFSLLKKLALQGKCVIVVSHDNSIKKFADKVLYMKKGVLYEETR